MAGDQQATQLRGGGGSRINWSFHLRACRRWESGGGEAEGRAEKRGMEPRGDGVVRVCLPGTPQSVSL